MSGAELCPVPAGSAAVRLEGDGVVLREWVETDLDAMVELFDEPTVAYRTPLPSPFTRFDAEKHLARARQGDRLVFAVTVDGERPLGEVMISAQAHIGYVIGRQHREQGLASRALLTVVEYAFAVLDLPVVLLEIEPDNDASTAVARRAGFGRADGPPGTTVEDKGRAFTLQVWERRRGQRPIHCRSAAGRGSASVPDRSASNAATNTFS